MPAPSIRDTTGAGASGSIVICDAPTNISTDILIAFVCGYQEAYGSPDMDFSISGWTQIAQVGVVDAFNTEVHTEAFYRVGGIAGQITVSSNKSCTQLNVVVYSIQGSTTSPDTSSTGTATYAYTHPINTLTTTAANDLLLKGWGFNEYGGFAALLIQDEIKAVAGATGTKYTNTPQPRNSANIMVALKPYPGPSIPELIWPQGGEQLTAGAGVTITWHPSTSPTADPATLKYNIDYSSNYGVSWTTIVSLTAAGATSYPWTVPSGLGNGYQIRIRAYDPAIAVYSQDYDYSGYFSVVAETTPGPPVITAPPAGSIQNKTANITVAWVHQGGAGNPQTEFTLQWDDNAEFSSPTTVGPTATSVQSTSIDFSALANGTTVYVKVKTKGLSLYSSYSSVRSFIVAAAPAAPNITAPTAGSPPTQPLPIITFTEADSFVSRRFRVVKAGAEVYDSGEVFSTSLSFTSPYSFANGVTVTIYLSVKNTWGLWSTEDSETVTPSYTGPATPTIAVNGNSQGGYIGVNITNSDTPSYNELWRFVLADGIETAIRVGAGLPPDATFSDYNVVSGVVYRYFARAYNSTGLYTDSAQSSNVSITLEHPFLHAVSRTSTSSNNRALSAVSLTVVSSEWKRDELSTQIKLLGRDKPVLLMGQPQWQRITVTAVFSSYAAAGALLTAWQTQKDGAMLCYRDEKGNRIFGNISAPTIEDRLESLMATFEVIEAFYVEGL